MCKVFTESHDQDNFDKFGQSCLDIPPTPHPTHPTRGSGGVQTRRDQYINLWKIILELFSFGGRHVFSIFQFMENYIRII